MLLPKTEGIKLVKLVSLWGYVMEGGKASFKRKLKIWILSGNRQAMQTGEMETTDS